MDFGDLKDDKAFQTKLADLEDSIDKTKNVLDTVLNVEDISSLSARDRVTFDLFQCYCLNTLFWVYLRTKGIDPNKNEVKNELNRIKSYMVKAKEVSTNLMIINNVCVYAVVGASSGLSLTGMYCFRHTIEIQYDRSWMCQWHSALSNTVLAAMRDQSRKQRR